MARVNVLKSPGLTGPIALVKNGAPSFQLSKNRQPTQYSYSKNAVLKFAFNK